MAASRTRSLSNVLLALLLVSVMWVGYTASQATATHEPANKAAAAGSDLDEINDTDQILSETFKVSSQEDMIIQVTSECSILTSLLTQGGPDTDSTTARTFGQVELFVTLDGKRVPVAVDDPTGPDPLDDPLEVRNANEQGEVVFCNRAYQRTITDTEEGDDGVDTERDFIRTRTANAFNWLGIDIGFAYDDACVGAPVDDPSDECESGFTGNGNNIIHAQLWAEFQSTNAANTCPTTAGSEATCSEAFVGSRTMILEPIKLSIHEQVEEEDPDGGS